MSHKFDNPSADEHKPVPNISPNQPGGVDPYTGILAREQRAREKMVAIAETKLLEQKVKECFKKEGINHYILCQKYTRAYYKRIARPDFAAAPADENAEE